MDLAELIQMLAQKFPVAIAILAAIGTFRVFFKSIYAAIGVAVGETESKKDDEYYKAVSDSKIFKVLSFILDLTTSIKVPPKKAE